MAVIVLIALIPTKTTPVTRILAIAAAGISDWMAIGNCRVFGAGIRYKAKDKRWAKCPKSLKYIDNVRIIAIKLLKNGKKNLYYKLYYPEILIFALNFLVLTAILEQLCIYDRFAANIKLWQK